MQQTSLFKPICLLESEYRRCEKQKTMYESCLLDEVITVFDNPIDLEKTKENLNTLITSAEKEMESIKAAIKILATEEYLPVMIGSQSFFSSRKRGRNP